MIVIKVFQRGSVSSEDERALFSKNWASQSLGAQWGCTCLLPKLELIWFFCWVHTQNMCVCTCTCTRVCVWSPCANYPVLIRKLSRQVDRPTLQMSVNHNIRLQLTEQSMNTCLFFAFTSHSNPQRWRLLVSWSQGWGHRSTERWCGLSKVTELVHRSTQTKNKNAMI